MGVSVAATAVALANAGEPAIGLKKTVAIPKGENLAARPAGVTARPVDLGDLKAGGALSPPSGTALPSTPLSGLSLDTLSLLPTAGARDQGRATERSPLTAQHGAIRYSVAPNATFTPYIGLGAGRAAGMLGTGLSESNGGADSLHSYQGVAGFAYRLDKDTRLDFDYRMSNTQRPDVPVLDNAGIADAEQDRAAILSFHYDLDPVLRRPPK